MVIVSPKYKTVVTGTQSSGSYAFSNPQELAAFSTMTGKQLWSGPGGKRPIINDRTILVMGVLSKFRGGEARSVDLLTGKKARLSYRVMGKHCGIASGSKWLVSFRSGGLGYTDLRKKEKTYHFVGLRGGCWVSAVFGGGLLIQSDSGYGCRCNFPAQAAFALEPVSSSVSGNRR